MRDIAQVGAVNATVLGVVTLGNLEVFLRCVLLTLTIAFTIWKWIRVRDRYNKK